MPHSLNSSIAKYAIRGLRVPIVLYWEKSRDQFRLFDRCGVAKGDSLFSASIFFKSLGFFVGGILAEGTCILSTENGSVSSVSRFRHCALVVWSFPSFFPASLFQDGRGVPGGTWISKS